MKDDELKNLASLLLGGPKKSDPFQDLFFGNSPSVVPGTTNFSLIPPFTAPPSQPAPAKPAGSPVSIAAMRGMATLLMGRKHAPDVNAGRVLPNLDDLAIGEGRLLNVAFVYADLVGFTKLVATNATTTSFSLIQAFVAIATRVTRHFGGEVVDCAGDRVLSVFYRAATDRSADLIKEAVTGALWLQTVFARSIAPVFVTKGIPEISVAIGVDYSAAAIGCVGIRNDKRLVFFGDAANRAAKLQDHARSGETALSPIVYRHRPSYLTPESNWPIRHDSDEDGQERYVVSNGFAADDPPARNIYLR